jgi:hypothetical protein
MNFDYNLIGVCIGFRHALPPHLMVRPFQIEKAPSR